MSSCLWTTAGGRSGRRSRQPRCPRDARPTAAASSAGSSAARDVVGTGTAHGRSSCAVRHGGDCVRTSTPTPACRVTHRLRCRPAARRCRRRCGFGGRTCRDLWGVGESPGRTTRSSVRAAGRIAGADRRSRVSRAVAVLRARRLVRRGRWLCTSRRATRRSTWSGSSRGRRRRRPARPSAVRAAWSAWTSSRAAVTDRPRTLGRSRGPVVPPSSPDPRAESQQETRLRRPPRARRPARRRRSSRRDATSSGFIARVDFAFPEPKIAIEYDGALAREPAHLRRTEGG